MSQKINIQDLAALLAEKSKISKKEAENFIKQWLECVEDGIIEGKRLKIKDLGTFKLSFAQDRESVDISTGEKLIIPAHYKINFDADNNLSETINEPFALFEPIEITEEDSLEDSSKAEITQTILTINNDGVEDMEGKNKPGGKSETSENEAISMGKKKMATQIDLFLEKDDEKEDTSTSTPINRENVEVNTENFEMEKEEIEDEEEDMEEEIEKEPIIELKEEPMKPKKEPVTFQRKTSKRDEIISSDDLEANWDKKRKKRRKRRRMHINWKLILVILAVLLVFGIIKYIDIMEEKDSYHRNRKPQTIIEDEKDSIETVTTVLPGSLDNDTDQGIEKEEDVQSQTEDSITSAETEKEIETTPQTAQTENTEVKPEQTQAQTVAQTSSQTATPKTLSQTSTQTPPQTSTQTPAQTSAQTPPQTSAQTPSQTSAQTTPQTSAQTQTKTASQTPPQTSTQTPSQTSAQTPAQTQTKTASQTQAQTTQSTTNNTLKKRRITNGEQLTSIAQEEYGNMIFWVYIYLENNSVISNPNSVPSGTEITIPPASKYKINKNDSESIRRATELQAQLF